MKKCSGFSGFLAVHVCVVAVRTHTCVCAMHVCVHVHGYEYLYVCMGVCMFVCVWYMCWGEMVCIRVVDVCELLKEVSSYSCSDKKIKG